MIRTVQAILAGLLAICAWAEPLEARGAAAPPLGPSAMAASVTAARMVSASGEQVTSTVATSSSILVLSAASPATRPAASIERATASGPAYTLKSYPSRHPRSRPALVLVPGIGFNGNLFDISSRISLARWLSDRGYPVWIFEPRWEVLEAEDPGHLSFRNLVDQVLPAAIAEIKAGNPERDLVLLGHSTGGTLIAGYLEHQPDPRVTGAVFIAPVLSLRFPDRVLRELSLSPGGTPSASSLDSTGATPGKGGLPSEAVAERATASAAVSRVVDPAAWLETPVGFLKEENYFGLLLTNHRPANRKELRTSISPALAPIPISIAGELKDWVSRGCCPIGDEDYFRDLTRIHVPVLLISGIADNIARREDVERAGLNIGSKDREYRMMSRTNFYSEDYGHLDLVATPEATREVYPHILSWLKGKRSGRPFPTR